MPAVPLREENYEAKKEARSQYTSMAVMKTSSRFSALISPNQLSIFGAIADLCKELSEDSESSGTFEASDHLETMEIPAGPHTNEQQRRHLVQDYERRFEQLSDDQELSKLCPDAGSRIVEKGQYFFTLDTEEGDRMQHSCREYTMPRCEKKTRAKG